MEAVIIGGGASGIACAIRIKQNNPAADVTVLEHLDGIGKKLYATGNGRCNITNTHAPDFEATKEFLQSLGLVLRESAEGRMYPYSNQAATVVSTFTETCRQLGIRIVTDCTVSHLEKTDGLFYIATNYGVFSADVLVLATGGKSQSALGSDGSGYAYARVFGHRITPLAPALVQLTSSSKHCRALKGVRCKCNLALEVNGTVLAEEFGELLFTEYGISGIVAMDLSAHVHDDKLKCGEEKCLAVIDFVPDMSNEELLAHFNRFGTLTGILPAKLCAIFLKQANGDKERAVSFAKSWRLIITGTKGYDFAQITKGGVALDELSDTNESKLCDNLYIVGELTDNQFPCGGYNLNYAISSAVRAADSMTNKHYD